MNAPPHLQHQMQAWFPADVLERLREAGAVAQAMGYSLYLIGGSIRDMLLERKFDMDIDLVSETYGVHHLAQALHQRWGGSLQTFERYGTAKLKLAQLDLDFATARTEHYAYPGANPEVSFSSLDQDLIRRDFSVNAMAVGLLPHQFGALIDPFGGWQDLQQRRLTALHAQKFLEDPVRCWRAARLAGQLKFAIEPQTSVWLREAMASGGFDGFFSARMRRELQKVLEQPEPLAYLRDLNELGVLRCLDAALDWPWLELFIANVPRHQALFKADPTAEPLILSVYLIGMVQALSEPGRARVLEALELTRQQLQAWQSLNRLLMDSVDWAELKPSKVYQRLEKLPEMTLWALLATGDSPMTQAVADYAVTWRFIRPSVSGTIIKEWLPPGPHIRQILQTLLFARLDGLITSPEQESTLARELAEQVKQSKTSD